MDTRATAWRPAVRSAKTKTQAHATEASPCIGRSLQGPLRRTRSALSLRDTMPDAIVVVDAAGSIACADEPRVQGVPASPRSPTAAGYDARCGRGGQESRRCRRMLTGHCPEPGTPTSAKRSLRTRSKACTSGAVDARCASPALTVHA